MLLETVKKVKFLNWWAVKGCPSTGFEFFGYYFRGVVGSDWVLGAHGIAWQKLGGGFLHILIYINKKRYMKKEKKEKKRPEKERENEKV